MSAWKLWSAPFDPKPKPYVRDPRPYSRTAPHIRGRVFRMDHKTNRGDWMWGMEVVNTSTGQVIASDNCANRQAVVDLAEEATAIARAAWFWSITRKKVRP